MRGKLGRNQVKEEPADGGGEFDTPGVSSRLRTRKVSLLEYYQFARLLSVIVLLVSFVRYLFLVLTLKSTLFLKISFDFSSLVPMFFSVRLMFSVILTSLWLTWDHI